MIKSWNKEEKNWFDEMKSVEKNDEEREVTA